MFKYADFKIKLILFKSYPHKQQTLSILLICFIDCDSNLYNHYTYYYYKKREKITRQLL